MCISALLGALYIDGGLEFPKALIEVCFFPRLEVTYLIQSYKCFILLRNEFNVWNVHGIMNTSGLLQSNLTLQETRSIHDSINIPKIEFIAYIYILL